MSRKNNSSFTLQFSIESQALTFLANINHGKLPQKCSRFQAFADLIAKYYSASLRGDEDGISVSELATVWGWSYPTVSAFIRRLESFGLVTTSKIGNCNFVALKPQNFVLSGRSVQDGQLCDQHENNAAGRII